MARIERKAHYVGTWREDVVTDTTMRQIIARSLAEKGQKVKVKLSPEGLVISKKVLLQENVVAKTGLQDVYFLTVNQRHPCCLLCIVADPVRKYLILALRTANAVEAQEIISTFKALKDNPTIDSGNVVLRRKDNGNWTLRERSQLNANRHLQEIFKEDAQPPPTVLSQPNGSTGGSYTPVIDGSKLANHGRRSNYRLVPEDDGGTEEGVIVVSGENEVDDLSKELQEVRFVVEKTGSVSSATLQSNTSYIHNNNTDESYYIVTDLPATRPEPVLNGGEVRVHSYGDAPQEERPGEICVAVEDHREDGVVRAHSYGSALPDKPTVIMRNGGISHPITVPESKVHTTTTADPDPYPATNSYTDIPAFKIQRRVSTELVEVPDFSRKYSQTGSLRSVRVSFNPDVVQHSRDPKFRSLRTSRSSGVPTTIVRPIEEIYGHHRPPVLKRSGGMYVAPPNTMLVAQQPGSMMYVARPVTAAVVPPPRRRSRPNSIHVMEGNELKVFHKTGQSDDILL